MKPVKHLLILAAGLFVGSACSQTTRVRRSGVALRFAQIFW
jgi:hypothetical protein